MASARNQRAPEISSEGALAALRCVTLVCVQETDSAAFTLVDAVAQVVSACKVCHINDNAVLPAIDKIVDHMNDCFLGKPYALRTASQFVSLTSQHGQAD